MNRMGFLLGFAAASVVMVGSVSAAEFKPASVRALGMGGSNVASTNGVDASYWNPAAYGFFGEDSADMKAVDNNGSADKDWGIGLDTGGGAFMFGSIADNLAKLADVETANGSSALGLSAAQLQSFAKLSNTLSSLDSTVGGYNIQASGALGTRVMNYGVGVRTIVDLNIGVRFDNSNVGMAGNFVNAVTNNGANSQLGGNVAVTAAGLDTAIGLNAYTPSYFSATQIADIRAQLTASPAYTADQAAAVVVAFDAGMGLDPTVAGQQDAMAQTLIDLSTAPGDLAQNQTLIETKGVAMSEVAFTYGYALNEALSLGGSIKYLQADMFVNEILAFGTTNATDNNTTAGEAKTGFGIDLGVLYRIPQWQFGLTVKNINAPSFEHSTGYVYELAAQAKLGAAWVPVENFTLEVGYDLTENQGAVAESLSQYWNVGLEYDAWDVLAIRLGAFENIAQSDIGLVQTAGLGLNLWAIRIDLAAAQSANKVVLNGKDVPTYVQFALALNIDF